MESEQMKIKLNPDCLGDLTFQDYKPQQEMAGVFNLPLTKHHDLEGSFTEYIRLNQGLVDGLPVPFEARQISVAHAVPGRINAFHVHPKEVQDEFWCVLDGTMLIHLVDLREGSSTLGHRQVHVLTGEKPTLLYIPCGVAHGYKAGPDGAILLYTMNSQFNPADPNEGRLSWDYFGKELWEENHG